MKINNTKKLWFRTIALILVFVMSFSMLSGCGKVGQRTDIATGTDATVKEYDKDSYSPVDRLENINPNALVKSELDIELEQKICSQHEIQTEKFYELKENIELKNFNEAKLSLKSLKETVSDDTNVNDYLSDQKKNIDSFTTELDSATYKKLQERYSKYSSVIAANIKEEQDYFDEIEEAVENQNYEEAINKVQEYEQKFIASDESYGATVNNSNKEIKCKSSFGNNLLTSQEDVQMSDNVTELADDLATVVDIYYYLKSNIDYEYYYGARKGSKLTLSTMAGNDYDQASLLIAMLRYLGYQAKYVRGTILLDADQAVDMTGAKSAEEAAEILASAGVPVTKLKKSGKIVKIKLEHVWVRAEVPYTNYRGAKPEEGDNVWIDLDTSIKEYSEKTTISDLVEQQEIESFTKDLTNLKSQEEIETRVKKSINTIKKNDLSEIFVLSKNPDEEYIGYLPLSLQYEVESVNEEFSTISPSYKDQVTFDFNGDTLGTYSSMELSGHSVQLYFEPASIEDEQILSMYSSIFDVPAAYVYFVPVIYIDGVERARGEDYLYTLGQKYPFTISMSFCGNVSMKAKSVSNVVSIGSMYAITFDTQNISSDTLDSKYSDIYDVARNIKDKKVYSIPCLGEYLSFVGTLYFSEIDTVDRLTAEQLDVIVTKRLNEGITGYEVARSVSHGVTTGILPGKLFIDIDSRDTITVSKNSQKENVDKYNVISGYTSSAYESQVWEQLTGIESVSTISIFEKAKQNGIELVNISNVNELDSLQITSVEKDELRNALDNM